MEARRFRRESVLITNNEGEREESGRDSRLPSRRIRAKSVHACSREFYSFPSFLSFFFFIFSNFQFLFSLVCTCVCVCCVFFPSFHAFSPLSFFSFSFQSTEERGIARNEIANCATSQKRVRRSLDKLHNLPNGFVLLRLFFSFFILLISVVSRVYACVCSPRVCVGGPPRTPAASLEKLEIIKADERTSTSFSTPPDDSGTLCARVPI